MDAPNRLVLKAYDVLRTALDRDAWIVGFSGGKDSSVLVDLVLRFIESEGAPKHGVYIIYSDTLLEPPPLRGYAIGVVKAVDNLLPGVQGAVVSPLDTGTDIVEMVIAKGYPAPSARFRWCTDRWKLLPANRFAAKLRGTSSKLAVITGVRAEEAAHRARRVLKQELQEAVGGTAYMPLLQWRAADVWRYIRSHRPRWGLPDWGILEKLYAGEETVRTGCWACTLIARDRAWEKLVEVGLIDRVFYEMIRAWRNLYLHFSRVNPSLWRLRVERGRWRYPYSKLLPEARLALGDCLASILQHPSYPPDASKPLLEKLGRILEELEENREKLVEKLKLDMQALKYYTACVNSRTGRVGT